MLEQKDNEKLLIKARQEVSDLILRVLTERICVREAIKLFPPDISDKSIECAWHALVHLEADEDIRRQDIEYAQEQNNYLELIAFTLQGGKPLPRNIIDSYKKYHEIALTPKSQTFIGFLKSIIRFTI